MIKSIFLVIFLFPFIFCDKCFDWDETANDFSGHYQMNIKNTKNEMESSIFLSLSRARYRDKYSFVISPCYYIYGSIGRKHQNHWDSTATFDPLAGYSFQVNTPLCERKSWGDAHFLTAFMNKIKNVKFNKITNELILESENRTLIFKKDQV